MRPSRHVRPIRGAAFVVAGLLLFGSVPLASADDDDDDRPPNRGFITSFPAMLDPVAAGVRVKRIISVGETAGEADWYMDAIPDGIAINPLTRRDDDDDDDDDDDGPGSVEIFLNHETSLVPFQNLSDLTNSQVSKITLNRKTGGVLDAEFVIPSSANYQRFCSSFIATREHGFDRTILFTNEEATDWVNRTGTAWPATPFAPGAEQAGVVVAYDVRSGDYKTIYGMGRHNHENSVAIPGYRDLVVLSGDDTFSAPASQLYSYIADDTDELLDDEGTLFAFKSNNAAINDYGDLSGGMSVSGTFIPVPRHIATGKDPVTGDEITGSDPPPTGVIPGPQWALEEWSNDNNVFQFIRVEDIAYDRKNPRIVYFADTGEPRAVPDATTGRLGRGPSGTAGPWPNGRIFKMVLDKKNPRKVQSLSILIDGDALGAAGAGNVSLIHQPDNIETTRKALLIQEDPGSQNQYDLGAAGTTARIWKYDFKTRSMTVVAKVNQAIDNAGLGGVPAIPGVPNDTQTSVARQGGWESSGIVDASRWFGRGWFLVDIQAGTYVPYFETIGGIRHEREGGQLLLVKIPGT